ncbi:MAG: MerR family DNA-binding transcriptional regulator, partial [Gammaproteobacteria bacterium]|nr:MerR family DNA-binding transcriptional regulator [Gammaproteobacteria bacterium]
MTMANSDHHLNDYTISQLAKDAGVSTDVIRNYELKGILSPPAVRPAVTGSMTTVRWNGCASSRPARRPVSRFLILRSSYGPWMPSARTNTGMKP